MKLIALLVVVVLVAVLSLARKPSRPGRQETSTEVTALASAYATSRASKLKAIAGRVHYPRSVPQSTMEMPPPYDMTKYLMPEPSFEGPWPKSLLGVRDVSYLAKLDEQDKLFLDYKLGVFATLGPCLAGVHSEGAVAVSLKFRVDEDRLATADGFEVMASSLAFEDDLVFMECLGKAHTGTTQIVDPGFDPKVDNAYVSRPVINVPVKNDREYRVLAGAKL